MKLLSRAEELLLLAVWRLQENAYAVTIRDQLLEVTGKSWAFGALFVSLDRLVKKGYLTSVLGEPTPERGGRSKRMYSLTRGGLQALIRIREIQRTVWDGVSDKALQKAAQ